MLAPASREASEGAFLGRQYETEFKTDSTPVAKVATDAQPRPSAATRLLTSEAGRRGPDPEAGRGVGQPSAVSRIVRESGCRGKGPEKCTVVNAVNGRTDCCHFPTSTACNCPGSVADALTATGNLASVGGPVSKETIIGELQAGRPTAARVAWVGKLKAPARFILENDDGQKAS